MVKLKESAELAEFNAAHVPAGYERVKIVRAKGSTLRFHGKVLEEVKIGSRNSGRRWLELILWETPGKALIAHTVRASDEEGEQDFEAALVVQPENRGTVGELAIMDFWNWSNPARSLARKLGWRFEEFVV